jgi:hypothetical protein
MSQNAISTPANPTGLNFRLDQNSANDTLASNFSGAGAPSSVVNYQFWVDTTNKILKQTDSAGIKWYKRAPTSFDSWGLSTPIASATTTDIGAANGEIVHITGTTTITGLGTSDAGLKRTLIFDSSLTLTHNGTSIILPSRKNILTFSGDSAEFESEGAGNWRCTNYYRSEGGNIQTDSNGATQSSTDSRHVNYFTGTAGLSTGYLSVKINGLVTATAATVDLGFMEITITQDDRDHSSATNPASYKFMIKGNMDAGVWYNTQALLLGTSTTVPINVRFTRTATDAYIEIGDTGTNWYYPTVEVSHVSSYILAGYTPSFATTIQASLLGTTATDSIISASPSASVMPTSQNFRITLTSSVPVTTANVTAATTLYFAPYNGNKISLYNGTSWDTLTSAQISISVPATTSQMYDVFVYNNAGVATLELLPWTNDTTRATALSYQDGVLCKTGALTRRYVGSFRTTAVSGQTEDSIAKRYVWNYYNRVTRPMYVTEITASWTYTLTTWRQANNNTANQLDFVIGVSEDIIRASLTNTLANSISGVVVYIGIGLDSITAPSNTPCISTISAAGNSFNLSTSYEGAPPVGRHIITWLEQSGSSGITTWYGTTQSKLKGNLLG